jgi:Ni/Co efflux regulator RcnB
MLTLQEKMANELKKEGNKGKDGEAIRKKLLAEDPEYKKIYEEIQSQGKAFSTKFKTKMFDVLTDEQWARLQQLIDNPPEHARAFRNRLQKQRGEAEKKGEWMPGPNSWRPGDPIPEQYRQQRNERQGSFPRGENE